MGDKVRIQDDLYLYVNQEKLDQLVIPDDMPYNGGFAELHINLEKTMMDEFASLEKQGDIQEENLAKAIRLYSIAKNVKKRNKEGIKPILKDLHFIQSTSDSYSLNRRLKQFVLNGYPLPFDFDVETDFKDTNKHCLMMTPPSTILPDATMYNPANPNKEAMLNMWKSVALQMLNFTDLSDEDKVLYLNDAMEFDAVLATLVKTSEERSEYIKMYNPVRTGRVNGLVKPVNFKSVLKKLFGYLPETIIVAEPRLLKGFKTLFNADTFSKYIHWAYVQFLLSRGQYLSEDMRNLSGAFRRALSGIAKPTDPDKFAYQLASNVFSEPVGYYYGVKYFGEEAKKDVIEMVKEIINAYKERIAINDILSDATKEKAIAKLDVMKIKMGYPDKIDEIYSRFEVNSRDSLFKVMQGIRLVRLFDSIEKLNKPVDKTRWVMPGHMVNACYNPTDNDITFPAAILQAPFYSIHQTRSQNLGQQK